MLRLIVVTGVGGVARGGASWRAGMISSSELVVGVVVVVVVVVVWGPSLRPTGRWRSRWWASTGVGGVAVVVVGVLLGGAWSVVVAAAAGVAGSWCSSHRKDRFVWQSVAFF